MLTNDRTVETEYGFLIDPFGAAPEQASRISGLGGGHPAAESGYAFRTLPILPRSRAMEFVIRFDGLRVEAGNLSIDLTATVARAGTAPVKLRGHVVSLTELAAGGEAIMSFEAERDRLYAIAAYVHGDAAVSANDVSVELRTTVANGRTAATLRAAVEHAAPYRLMSLELPDFGEPVSQVMSEQQCSHSMFRHWSAALPMPGNTGRERRWSQAFVLQALDRYGGLRSGARVLGIGAADAAVEATLSASGCRTTRANEPSDGRPYDCAWSLDLDAGRDRFEHAVWHSVERLAPGGVAVHVCTLSHHDGCVDRAVIERAALNLVSHGHAVAQLKFRLPDQKRRSFPDPMPFGLILCRS